MSRTRRSIAFIPLLITTLITGAGFASPASSGEGGGAQQPANLSEVLATLHAVGQWSVNLSQMADQRAKSTLVKDYAREVATTNGEKDAKLMSVAKSHGITVPQLSGQTEEGKSLLSRMKAEATLLGSLEGDAFDKEYMTLVTNTQQSVTHFLKARRAAATDQDVKQLLDNMLSNVQHRIDAAQEIMAKVYGDKL